MSGISLTEVDRRMLDAADGEAAAMAMPILVRSAAVMGATHLVDFVIAHIDGCLDHGQTSLDFVDRLFAAGGRVRIPTTLNVGFIDLIHPELFHGTTELRPAGTRLMQAHLALGCESTFTCSPYQLKNRPRFVARLHEPNPTQSCSQIRCWAHARTVTAISSTSVLPSQVARPTRGCTSNGIASHKRCSSCPRWPLWFAEPTSHSELARCKTTPSPAAVPR